ncbi:hypothetical protein [Niabella ginsengisoli]|uniref:Uncharacterized protein n=1 Tax=Niabella ginsengisoli TaxID=522298 RepID=A0ABS9SKR3_9BACT|nr:hypothetical protein [Niabella ginsengisoli]MCH5598953.1 hypothetical protein [Niabella ginsengisoli]
MIEPSNEKTEAVSFKTYARKSGQPLMPQQIKTQLEKDDQYSVYPYHALGSGNIKTGYESLAEWILEHQGKVAIDGMNGVFWNEVHDSLSRAFAKTEKKYNGDLLMNFLFQKKRLIDWFNLFWVK